MEDRFLRNTSDLYAMVKALSEQIPYVIIDEIQKAPKLLDRGPSPHRGNRQNIHFNRI